MIIVRDATLADAERILDIYDYYIQNTAITFEYDRPTLEEFQQQLFLWVYCIKSKKSHLHSEGLNTAHAAKNPQSSDQKHGTPGIYNPYSNPAR